MEEEEEIIGMHKSTLDDLVDSVKEQMAMLQDVDQPGSDVQNYAQNLGHLLSKNLRSMTALSDKINLFATHLKDEQELSNKYYTEKAKIDGDAEGLEDVFDMDDTQGDDLLA